MLSLIKVLRTRLKQAQPDKELPKYEQTNIKLVIVEIFILIGVVYVFGFAIDRSDPLLLENKYGLAFHIFPVAVLSLFYGFFAGVLYLVIFAMTLYIVYSKFTGTLLLLLLLYLLVLSEFNFYWSRVIEKYGKKADYLSDRLRDVGRALYITKLSHDRLEKYNISKPISIRGFLTDVRKQILKTHDLQRALKEIFMVVVNIYSIEKAGLYEVTKGKAKEIIEVGGMETLDMQDRLVNCAFERGEVSYVAVSSINDYSTKYLCVIPLYLGSEIKYVFVIEKMPFLNLNSDNILSIGLLFYYILQDYADLEAIGDLNNRFPTLDFDFIKELNKCSMLKKKYGIESSLVLLDFGRWDESIYYFILENIRGLDIIYRYGDQKLLILLSFTDPQGAYQFVKRVNNLLKELKGVDFVQLRVFYQIHKVEDINRICAEIENFGLIRIS